MHDVQLTGRFGPGPGYDNATLAARLLYQSVCTDLRIFVAVRPRLTLEYPGLSYDEELTTKGGKLPCFAFCLGMRGLP